jgi:transposase
VPPVLGPPKARNLDIPSPVCLESLVPANHFYRHLERALDLSFVRDLVAGRYAGAGRPSIDPVVFFKLQLVMFFEGIRSERQLMQVVEDRLSLRCGRPLGSIGYDFDERIPDHSSLTRIRDRYGPDLFHRFFEQIVERCRDAGLVRGHELFIDATKVRANADIDSLVPRWYVKAKQHVDALFNCGTDAEGGDVAAPQKAKAGRRRYRLPPRRSSSRSPMRTTRHGDCSSIAASTLSARRRMVIGERATATSA